MAAAAAAAAPDPLAEARRTLAKTCDALTTRSTFFPPFIESKGSVDYMRWRTDLFSFVSGAGADFKNALDFNGNINAQGPYNAAHVNDDTLASVIAYTMPQMRQKAILYVIRATLPPDGESVKLIRDCEHAGGTILNAAGIAIDQARIILDRRWRSTVAAAVDTGAESRSLHSMVWPTEFSADAYNTFFNAIVSHASKSNVNPNNDNADSTLARVALRVRVAGWHASAIA